MTKIVRLKSISFLSIVIFIFTLSVSASLIFSYEKDSFPKNEKDFNHVIIPTINIPSSVYIGNSSTVHKQFIADDVRCFDMEQYNDTIYIVYGTYNNDNPEIFMTKYWLSNHSFSNSWKVGQYDTSDHFQVSQAIDDDGYIHLVWSTKKRFETYIRSQNPLDIKNWTDEQLFCDSDSTYNEIYCYGDTVYNFYRDGLHGYGWKLTWKRRNETSWTKRKIISGIGKDPRHPYMYTEGAWLFENPDEQYFTYYWTQDVLVEFRYQRITHYNFSAGKHYHLNGTVIKYLNGSTVPHEGPYDYYGQCGDFISDNWQNKTPGSEKGRFVISVEKTNDNIVVMSNVGENPEAGFPPRTLQCSIWDGSSWSYKNLNFSIKEDFGALRIGRCQGADGESLWLVPRKPYTGSEYSATTDISIIRCRNGGNEITWENFTNNNSVWASEPEALYNVRREQYIIGWLENVGDKDFGNKLYIGYKSLKTQESLPTIKINNPKNWQSYDHAAPHFNIIVNDPDGINKTWYTIDGGITNITFTGNGTIDQGNWTLLDDGLVTIRFYANDSLGNINSKAVIIFKDTRTPSITINYPLPNSFFSISAPEFNIIVKDLALHTTWYTIDGGLTNISFSGNGTIDQGNWALLDDGPVTIRFYANDSLGNINSKSVTIFKDTNPPNITINNPRPNGLFSALAPEFNITINDLTLHTSWYTIDGGITNITFTETVGIIHQSLWDALIDGEILITFYTNDSVGFVNYKEVTIRKDTTAPNITIIIPKPGQDFENVVPFFSITIVEPNLGIIWYTIDGGITNTTITYMTGYIDQSLWANSSNGLITIRFYAQDLVGYLAYAEITVRKSATKDKSLGITIDYPFYIIVISSYIVILIILRKKAKRKHY